MPQPTVIMALSALLLTVSLAGTIAFLREARSHPLAPTGPILARDVAPLQQGAEMRRITAIMTRR